jgi:enoyl-CoA hydratase/carnithine racemase
MCSSYTFPKIFGRQKAFELIALAKVLSLQEALQYGFVNQSFETLELRDEHTMKIAQEIA